MIKSLNLQGDIWLICSHPGRFGRHNSRKNSGFTIFFALVALIMILAVPGQASGQRLPVIDVHLHGYTGRLPAGMPADWANRPESRELRSPEDAETHMKATIAEMDKYNIVLGVVSAPESALRAWHKAAPGRFIGGAELGEDGLPEYSVDSLRSLVSSGVVGVFGELGLQYFGIAPGDSRLEAYYNYVHETEIPIALHTGLGPPGGPHTFAPEFRVTLGRPSLFEPVIAGRPGLRAYLMHAGWPYLEEMTAMMYIYPDLYVDIGVLVWALPLEAFYTTLRTLINAGFGDRLMFGSDQMIWPGAIGISIETIEAVPFLTEDQKRAILYHNAARFLRLSEEQIAAHHGR
jgi:uncharacterized protein